ncbi:MAG: dienelactone hydrolase family protein [Candidatus Dormibacteraeota bacterium]|nr:dienelactone hydrolase family protein [Candidatus Dormibacteraeota bacterium]
MAPLPVMLAHGASGTSASMRPHLDGLRARGIEATAIDLPKGRAERAVPVFAERLAEVGPAVIGGHSYGGRVASMLAASGAPAVRGLVLLSYPLHRPGHPEDQRTEHWPNIHCPALFLSGDADPFARLELLRDATAMIKGAELVIYRRSGHGLGESLGDALDQLAAFVQRLRV